MLDSWCFHNPPSCRGLQDLQCAYAIVLHAYAHGEPGFTVSSDGVLLSLHTVRLRWNLAASQLPARRVHASMLWLWKHSRSRTVTIMDYLWRRVVALSIAYNNNVTECIVCVHAGPWPYNLLFPVVLSLFWLGGNFMALITFPAVR